MGGTIFNRGHFYSHQRAASSISLASCDLLYIEEHLPDTAQTWCEMIEVIYLIACTSAPPGECICVYTWVNQLTN